MVSRKFGDLLRTLLVHQVLIGNLIILSYVGIIATFDPGSLAKSVQDSKHVNATVEITGLHRELVQSSGPTSLALAFVCARALWTTSPLEGKRETLIVTGLFHTGNLLVLGLQKWDVISGHALGEALPTNPMDDSDDIASGDQVSADGNIENSAPPQITNEALVSSRQLAFMDLIFEACFLLFNVGAIYACQVFAEPAPIVDECAVLESRKRK
mmetsp:Transcript_82862/g.130290  ORF Transcript_82862/g.130290 Transcript_82862/m.130290 type:complete len:213 (+) Transcript_82862:59-697(+)